MSAGALLASLRSLRLSAKVAAGALLLGLGAAVCVYTSDDAGPPPPPQAEPARAARKPKEVKGIHLTSWVAGSKKARERFRALLRETELNAVVIAIKEYQGDVYIPGVPLAHKQKTFVNAIPDLKEALAQYRQEGVYTIARVVVFKDSALARKRPDLAVLAPDGSVWKDRRGNSWADPYDKEVWEYNFSVATNAVALGFDEIQFDYIRFPSDGDTRQCRYSYAQHNSSSAARSLDAFLVEASKRLRALGANVSIDIFGLTPSVEHDMGIGQKIMQMAETVDYVSPMVYPSHYARGEYGIRDPNREPYKVVYKTMSDAKRRLGERVSTLRPYLQDFSLGYKYGPREVRAQIEACEDLGIREWLLWSPNCNYTRLALKTRDGALSEEGRVPAAMKARLEGRKSGSEAAQVSTAAAPALSEPLPAVNPGSIPPKEAEEPPR